MAVLGKRKAEDPSTSEIDANEIFRKHFEARFLPLEPTTPTAVDEEQKPGESEEDESEWGGLSDDNDEEEDDDDDTVDEYYEGKSQSR